MMEFTRGIDKNEPVALARLDDYNVETLENTIRDQLGKLGCRDIFDGKRVVIKPNLVMKKSPEAAATTHPAVLEAMLRVLQGSAKEIIIAESPPGLYTEASLKGFYNACGISAVAEKYGAKLNFDTSSREVTLPDAMTAHGFELITPLLDADVIVNLAKLKSHALTKFSGAVKNYFGTIPGLAKVETHARFPDYNDFGSMLVDLCAFHAGNKPTFNLLDGIIAMEGNGPTGGEPRRLGYLIAGLNPFNVDIVGTELIGFDNVIMLEEAKRRGYAADSPTIRGRGREGQGVDDFVRPDSAAGGGVSAIEWLSKAFGGRLYRWLQPRPVVDVSKCVGCGECARSCPKKTIELIEKGGKRRAHIKDADCIKCYCCQELCPVKAVRIHKNLIMKLLGG